MYEPFTSFSQIRPNLLWVFDRVTKEQKHQRYWANDRVNIRIRERGFEPVDPKTQNIRYNWFRTLTEFYVQALWSEVLILNNQNPTIPIAFEEATRWLSMKGYGIVVFDPQSDRYMSVDPSLWHPVRHPKDYNTFIGHILAYPWRTKPTDQAKLPDRIDLVLIGEENGKKYSERRTYAMDGTSLGHRLTTVRIPEQRVAVFGYGISDYVDIEDLVLTLEKRITKIDKVLDKHSNPHIQGPTSAKNAEGKFDIDQENGSFLPRDEDDVEYEYLTWDARLDAAGTMIGTLMDALHISTGIPATAFGISDTQEQSGVSRERQLFTALKKVQAFRRHITRAMQELSIEVSWTEMPFAGFAERANVLGELFDRNLISAEEARQRLGIPGPPPEPRQVMDPNNPPNDDPNNNRPGNGNVRGNSG